MAKTLCEKSGTAMFDVVPDRADGLIGRCLGCQRALVPKKDGTSRQHSVKGPSTRSSDQLNDARHYYAKQRLIEFGVYADAITLGWVAACHAYNTVIQKGLVIRHIELVVNGTRRQRPA